MDKKQFRLQVEHNHYMRGIAASVCKVLVWSGVYVFAVWIVMTIATAIAASSKGDGNAGSASFTAAYIIICIMAIVLGLLVWGEVSSKIKEHKRISDLEDAYFDIAKPNNEKKYDNSVEEIEEDLTVDHDDASEYEEEF